MLFLFVAGCGEAKKELELPTPADTVDIPRYLGFWYEYARYPNDHQDECLETTAQLVSRTDGRINILVRCRHADGEIEEHEGLARIPNSETPTMLEVSFVSALIRFWSDFWILDIEENYQDTVLGDPDREYLWIFSRTQTLGEAREQQIRERLERDRYDLSRLTISPQNVDLATIPRED